ncbi:putative glutathione S-transferase [Daldinia caldariorum]|uniref:putative glutathione S-transferase n=1 Tax=Daldinia caldariorum TaxID=326644 RepID=UPI00200779BE|nr:putative glutathione S-transferase [Daldinia caldariorum]KAI1464289.1 putative glutathione S-transferase [Daldinia caldariorum]
MANQEIVLFDLPSRPPNKSWSYNPWKTRLVLNYKNLPYKTEWVEYPDIKGKFQDHLPKADVYTIPTIILPDGTWVTDSWTIAETLEKEYPEPTLHLDSPYLSQVKQLLAEVLTPLKGIYAPKVHDVLLNDASKEYFRTTREKAFGATLEEVAEKEGGEEAWKAAQPALEKATALLKENGDGPFFEGKTLGFADLAWASLLIFFQRMGDDVYQAALKHSGDASVHEKLLEAVKPWSERSDH